MRESETHGLSHCSFVYVLARIAKLLHRPNDDSLELVSPNGIELIDLLVLLNGELGKISYKALRGLRILLGLEPIVLDLLLSIFLGLIGMRLLLDLR
jgi:hypothetical protein